MPAGSVTIVGSFLVGLTLRADRMPVAGETIVAHDFDLGPGGKGSNQAVQAARAGAAVEFVTVLGTDRFAEIAEDLYAAEGVGTRGIRRTSKRSTGVGFIILDAAGENRILIDPGCTDLFSPKDVDASLDVVTGAGVVATQLEIPVATAAAAMAAAKRSDAVAILNPAPARPLAPDILADVDILTPNQSEARLLCGLEPDDPAPDEDVCARLRAAGAETIVMTRGARGALISSDEGIEEAPAPAVDVVDTTGAGDAFNGTLAASLAAGLRLRDAVVRATVAGAFACTALGVVPALPYEKQIEEAIGR